MELLTSYHDLMILSILFQADSYGYELSKRIKALTRDQFTIKEPTLYAALDRLRLAGLADSYDGSLTYGRKRQYFRITLAGKQRYKELCEQWRFTREAVEAFVKPEKQPLPAKPDAMA